LSDGSNVHSKLAIQPWQFFLSGVCVVSDLETNSEAFDADDLTLMPVAEALCSQLTRIGGTAWTDLDDSGRHFYLGCVEIVANHLKARLRGVAA
jgi:hypothetical protein